MELYRMGALSTKHLSEETVRIMREDPDSIPVAFYEKSWPANGDYAKKFPDDLLLGWFIHIPEDEEDLEEVPEDLMAIIRFAGRYGFDWIMLDEDVEYIEGELEY